MSDSNEIYRKALKYEKEGDWTKAHDLIQNLLTTEAARIHAYLHRKEGDEWNANYWYGRAGVTFYEGALDEEWESL